MGLLALLLFTAIPQVQDPGLEIALGNAGENRSELEAALGRVTESERLGLEFLIRNMPNGDLKALSADYLVEHVQVVYRAWSEAPWSETVPEKYFLENVLPYATINERRDFILREGEKVGAHERQILVPDHRVGKLAAGPDHDPDAHAAGQ